MTYPAWIKSVMVSALGVLTVHGAAPRYRVVDLGSLGAPGAHVYFSGLHSKLLNERGAVAAGMDTATADPLCFNGGQCLASHGFLWENGTLSDLGLLVVGDQSEFSQSFSMNEQNTCVGISTYNERGFPDEPLYRAVMWKATNGSRQIIDLGTLGGNQSLAHAINNRDQVVGWALNSTPEEVMIWDDYPWPLGAQQRAVLWENGTIRDLGTLGGPSAWASHINDRGQIVGSSYTSADGNGRHSVGIWSWSRPAAAFLWEDGKMIDLGSLGGTYGLATHINNQGEIIGIMAIRGDSALHPFFWKNGRLTDLGTLGGTSGEPHDINESGQVVGLAMTSSGAHHPFLWRNGVMKDLGTLGSNSGQAWAINAKSQVVGTSGPTLTQDRAFLWEDDGGPMRDLNSLVPVGSPILAQGMNINDRGEILALGLNEQGLYLLIPLPTLSVRTLELPAGRKIVVEGQTIPGRSYRLESTSDLKTWSGVGAPIVADLEITTWELEGGTGSVFCRIAGPLF